MLGNGLLPTVVDEDPDLGDGVILWYSRPTVSASCWVPKTRNTATHSSPGLWQGGFSHSADSNSQAMSPNFQSVSFPSHSVALLCAQLTLCPSWVVPS